MKNFRLSICLLSLTLVNTASLWGMETPRRIPTIALGKQMAMQAGARTVQNRNQAAQTSTTNNEQQTKKCCGERGTQCLKGWKEFCGFCICSAECCCFGCCAFTDEGEDKPCSCCRMPCGKCKYHLKKGGKNWLEFCGECMCTEECCCIFCFPKNASEEPFSCCKLLIPKK